MNPPGNNFANDAIWYKIIFNVLAFYFFGQKLKTVSFENPNLNPNNPCVVEKLWFS